MNVAQCPVCRGSNVIVERDRSGRMLGRCLDCGHVTAPVEKPDDLRDQLRWIPLAELEQERRL